MTDKQNMKVRVWELIGKGDQHNIWIEAKRLNGDCGWNDFILSEPVKVIEHSAYEQLKKDAQVLVEALRDCVKNHEHGNDCLLEQSKQEKALKTFNEKYGVKL